MDDRRKRAYRHLLYRATLDIRPVKWMHNLALFSSLDFQWFSEERFWQDYDGVRSRSPEFGMERYRERFEMMTSAREDGVTNPLLLNRTSIKQITPRSPEASRTSDRPPAH
jgi:hypothetical protein